MPSSRLLVGRGLSLFVATIGLALMATPWISGEDLGMSRGFAVVLGVALLAAAIAGWLVGGTRRDPGRRTSLGELDGAPAFLVGLRPTTPLVMIVIGTGFALLSLAAVLGVGVTDGGLLFTPFLLLFLALVPDAARGLARGPRLALGVDTIDYRGWTIDSRLAWDDVLQVELESPDTKYAAVRFVGRPDAASWTHSSGRLILPLDRKPGGPEIRVLLSALDAPDRVLILARRLAALAPEERAEVINEEGVGWLSDSQARLDTSP